MKIKGFKLPYSELKFLELVQTQSSQQSHHKSQLQPKAANHYQHIFPITKNGQPQLPAASHLSRVPPH